MSVVAATARVAPATPVRCSRRACSCGCAARTRSAESTRRAARTGASLAPTRGSSRRGKALTRMSATPGKNAPIATEDAPEMDRAVFAAATGLFSPVGTSPRVRPRPDSHPSPPETRSRASPPRVRSRHPTRHLTCPPRPFGVSTTVVSDVGLSAHSIEPTCSRETPKKKKPFPRSRRR